MPDNQNKKKLPLQIHVHIDEQLNTKYGVETMTAFKYEQYARHRRRLNEQARIEARKQANNRKYMEASATVSLLLRPEEMEGFERIYRAVERSKGRHKDEIDSVGFTVELFEFNQALYQKNGVEIEASTSCESDFMMWCYNKSLPVADDAEFVDVPVPVSAFIDYEFSGNKKDDENE